MKLFSLDGPFQRYGTMLFDMLLLNLIWLMCVIFTLGIGTGAATTALFYVVDKSVIRDKGYVMSNFFKSFKSNFVKATISWVILAIAFGIVGINLFVIDLGTLPFAYAIKLVNYVVFIQLLFVSIYIFQLLGRVEIAKTNDYFVTSFKLANRHFINSFLSIGVLVGTAFVLYYFPIYILLSASVTVLLLSKLITFFVMKKYFDKEALDS